MWVNAHLSVCTYQFSSVTQSCPTLCDPMECNTLGFPVHHQFPELAQTHVHWVADAIQPSHTLLSSSPPAFNFSQPQSFPSCLQFFPASVFSNESVLRIRWPKYWSFSFSISPSSEYLDWFPGGLTDWISLQSKGLPRVFSKPQLKTINSLVFSVLYSSTVLFEHDYRKDHSFD